VTNTGRSVFAQFSLGEGLCDLIVCLKLFAWADFRSTKAGNNDHTVIDLQDSIPVMLSHYAHS